MQYVCEFDEVREDFPFVKHLLKGTSEHIFIRQAVRFGVLSWKKGTRLNGWHADRSWGPQVARGSAEGLRTGWVSCRLGGTRIRAGGPRAARGSGLGACGPDWARGSEVGGRGTG